MKMIIFMIQIITFIVINGDKHKQLRIRNGHVAKLGQFPYFVQIVQENGSNYGGGAIINKKAALTIDYCCQSKAEELVVYAGSIDLKSGTKYNVDEVILYTNQQVHDICILKMKTEFTFSPIIGKISLPFSGDLNTEDVFVNGALATIMGFGTAWRGGQLSQVLRYNIIPVYDQERCEHQAVEVKERFICAAFQNTPVDVCLGDFGAPMVYEGLLIGLTKLDVQCGMQGNYSVFTNVPLYVNWIEEILNIISKSK